MSGAIRCCQRGISKGKKQQNEESTNTLSLEPECPRNLRWRCEAQNTTRDHCGQISRPPQHDTQTLSPQIATKAGAQPKKNAEMRRARFRGSGGNRQGDSAKDLLTESRQVSTVAQEKKKSNSGAPAQPSPVNFGAPRSTFASTSALPVNLASNFGAPGQLSPAISALLVNFASTFGSPSRPSHATSALQVDLRQHLRRSRSTFVSNLGAPGQSQCRSRHQRRSVLRITGDKQNVDLCEGQG